MHNLLVQPRSAAEAFGDREFTVAAPPPSRAWAGLSPEVRCNSMRYGEI